MGQKEKLIERLKSRPKDFTFEEAESILISLGYVRKNNGRTSGSSVRFVKVGCKDISLHRPHPRKELLTYQINIIVKSLEEDGLI